MDFQALKVFDALIMILNPEWVFLQERMRNYQIHTVPRTTCTYHMEKITGTLFYIYWKWLLFRVELSGWKGSVSNGLGADISLPPSLPGDRYLKLGSKSDLRAEISGSIVWYNALAPRPEVLRSFSCLYANSVFWVFCSHMCKCPKVKYSSLGI